MIYQMISTCASIDQLNVTFQEYGRKTLRQEHPDIVGGDQSVGTPEWTVRIVSLALERAS